MSQVSFHYIGRNIDCTAARSKEVRVESAGTAHRVPTCIDVCTLTQPVWWTTEWACPMTFITSSQLPSVFSMA